ncbi:Alpha/beta hydrolase domain-containing protein 11 [Terramyces sp. JEL0728]|nr:Alpha/beta hydrolase domain-containing protein 11 [Terramyces sp. JEL0728]
MKSVKLAFSKHSPPVIKNPPLVILPGLFGSKQNWTSLSKSLSKKLSAEVFALDLRNHGDSPHTQTHSYDLMAVDVQEFIQPLGPVNLMGHSMGGKVSMYVALQEPQLLNKLVVVDVSPIPIKSGSLFKLYITEMTKLSQMGIKSMKHADEYLARTIPGITVRQFLLTNLKQDGGEYKFRINLSTLGNEIDGVWGFDRQGVYNGETLFIQGTRSDYIPDNHFNQIRQMFPKSEFAKIDAGHWYALSNARVHASRPNEFMDAVVGFLKS